MKNAFLGILLVTGMCVNAQASVSVSFDARNGTFEQLCKCGEITNVGGAPSVVSVSFKSAYAATQYGVSACNLTFLGEDLALGGGLSGAIGKYISITKVNKITTYSVSDKCNP